MKFRSFLAHAWLCLSIFLIVAALPAIAQNPVERIEPPFWYTGMKIHQTQIMVYGKDIATYQLQFSYPGVRLQKIAKTENPDYLFIYLHIGAQAEPGTMQFNFSKGKRNTFSLPFELRKREINSAYRKGFDASDAIYLLMPDRFANGNPDNDNLKEMKQGTDRSTLFGRQGGDIQGIIDHLDYIASLGMTAIWHTPVFENNQPRYSYHGYAITDFYRVDPRMGSLDDYIRLVKAAHQKDIKIIKDFIFNHIGDGHWWKKNPPSGDWWHQWESYTQSSFRAATITDPYASEADLDLMTKGWFDSMMPDLNQLNPLLSDYLIQNSLWWIETTGIDGIRVDTQPYPHKEFISKWAQAIMTEYPHFSIVGEAWINKPAQVAYFQGGAGKHDGYNSHIGSVFDFPLNKALTSAFTENAGWETGLMRLYETIAEDFVYTNPYNLVLFADNHDVHRIFSTLNEDPKLLKQVLTLLATTRGIPMFYYGTELAMPIVDKGHEGLRPTFPGGFPNDQTNAFETQGRTKMQQEVWSHLQTILNFRKNTPALHYGRLLHFVPKDNIYVYFRIKDRQTVMVVLNNNPEDKTLELARFNEVIKTYKSAEELFSKTTFDLKKNINLPAKSSLVLLLKE